MIDEIQREGPRFASYVLREAGLVRREVDAQRRIYSVEPEGLRAIAAWSIWAEEFWTESLDRLAALFAQKWGG